MSFALAFVGAVLALLWLPAAVLIGAAVYASLWAVVVLALGGVLVALMEVGRWAGARIPPHWGLPRRVAAAAAIGCTLASLSAALTLLILLTLSP